MTIYLYNIAYFLAVVSSNTCLFADAVEPFPELVAVDEVTGAIIVPAVVDGDPISVFSVLVG